MIIILDPMFYIIYMIIINFLIEACFLGYIRALCNFMSNYLYNMLYIGIICVQGLSLLYPFIILYIGIL